MRIYKKAKNLYEQFTGGHWTETKIPLHQAVDTNNLEVVKYLVKRGADKGATDDFGRTPQPSSMVI